MPRCTVERLRKGTVGCKRRRPSTTPISPSYQSSACRQTSTEDAASVANSGGRSQGTNAPAPRATSAIAEWSVETSTSQISRVPLATSMLHTIKGLPPRGRMFFPGSRFDPPRAGTSARILKLIDPAYSPPQMRNHPRASHLARAHISGTRLCMQRWPANG